MRKNITSLDAAKWISALLMVVIHTQPFRYYSEIVDFLTARVIAPVGISVFFAISGYLLGQKFKVNEGTLKNNKTNRKILWKYQKHNILLYLISSAIYLLWQIPRWYTSGWWGFAVIKDFATSFLFSGSYYHLWYVLALLYAVPLLYLLMCYFKRKYILWLCGFGWLIECAIYSYEWLFQPFLMTRPIAFLLSHFLVIFVALFRAIPLLYIGVLVGNKKESYIAGQWEKQFISAIAFWMMEVSALKWLSPNNSQYAYLLSTPIITYYMMQYIIHLDLNILSENAGAALRKASLLIYILHPLIIDLYSYLQFPDGFLCWCTVTFLSVTVTVIFFKIIIRRA